VLAEARPGAARRLQRQCVATGGSAGSGTHRGTVDVLASTGATPDEAPSAYGLSLCAAATASARTAARLVAEAITEAGPALAPSA
jgi:hypothetical protein